jgi:hypothetical protein
MRPLLQLELPGGFAAPFPDPDGNTPALCQDKAPHSRWAVEPLAEPRVMGRCHLAGMYFATTLEMRSPRSFAPGGV